VKTAGFRNAGKDPNAVSIARSAPKAYAGKHYAPLTPADTAHGTKRSDLDAEYRPQLAALDPAKVYADLVDLAGPDALLLCNEPPRRGEPCRRRPAAEWLEAALGIEIPKSDRPRPQFYVAICSSMHPRHPERYDEAKNARLRDVDHIEGSRVIQKPESKKRGAW
jgi:hypothetical protein